MDAAKAIRFSDVAGVRNGGVIEAPIITEYRLRQYYSFNGRILLSEIVQTNIEKNELACRTLVSLRNVVAYSQVGGISIHR
jgi:hypothetical protein